MTETPQLLSIGEFSRLSRLSVRMLRHYDSVGVLVPAAVDPWTGYRSYAPQQLAIAADVRNLRDVGFGVSAIAALLAARDTPAWRNALELQCQTLTGELRAAQNRLALINRLLNEGEHTMPITVERTTVPARTVVSLRGIVPTYADEGQLWQRLMPALAQQGIEPIGACGVIEHDAEYTEHDVDLQVFMPVRPGTTAASPLEIVELPERDCMVARVVGPYDQISRAHDLINERMAADGLQARGGAAPGDHAFNVYLTTPQEVAPDELVTEVCLPLA